MTGIIVGTGRQKSLRQCLKIAESELVRTQGAARRLILRAAGIEAVGPIDERQRIAALGRGGGLEQPRDERPGSAAAPPGDDLRHRPAREAAPLVEAVEQVDAEREIGEEGGRSLWRKRRWRGSRHRLDRPVRLGEPLPQQAAQVDDFVGSVGDEAHGR